MAGSGGIEKEELFREVSGHCYWVKNQNGFNAALYHYFSDSQRTKKQIREMVQNFPEKYPTTIVIVDQSFECARVYVETIDEENLKTK